jgi:hypothetical protein
MASTTKDAKDLIFRSPLTYTVSSSHESDDYSRRGTMTEADVKSPPDAKNGSGLKQFVIHIFPNRSSKHVADVVSRAPLHGPWPSAPETDSFIARTLRKAIPPSEHRDALADWETAGQLVDGLRTGEGPSPTLEAERHFQRRARRREERQRVAEHFDAGAFDGR